MGVDKKLTIGFIGNFIPLFSTENERKLSFEKLGHTVIPFQENNTDKHDLLAVMSKLDMLVYSHTHDPSFVIEGLREVFYLYKKSGIPTVSCHLDRWAGLARVSDVGNEATWFTEHIFMADASSEAQELYKKYNLNWHWLKPGVVEKDCYMATPDYKRFNHDIIFVGSKGYHPEYPWRPQIINWLRQNYGERFGHYGGDGLGVVRQGDLNTLYASAKIVVGDSCFASETTNYWSDRIPETTGRGGFLVHPWVEGCDHRGVVFFKPKTFDSLRDVINYYLQAHDEREQIRKDGFEWTKNNRTYTHLAQEIINTIWK
jgi:hypothetical protein